MKRRRSRKRQSGFALFAVIILLALMTAAVALALDEAVASMQSAGGVRASEMIKAGLEHGLGDAIVRIQQEDVATIVDPASNWDIFAGASPDGTMEFVPPVDYPTDGPYRNQYRVRIGLRPGQRTRAPSGENVLKTYGQILEVQVGVEARGAAIPPAEERVTVGILVPRQASHSN